MERDLFGRVQSALCSQLHKRRLHIFGTDTVMFTGSHVMREVLAGTGVGVTFHGRDGDFPVTDDDAFLRWDDNPHGGASDLARRRIASAGRKLINETCGHDKAKSDALTHAIFGLRLSVDPVTHVGPLLRKGRFDNGQKSGVVMNGPLPDADHRRFIYQRILDNRLDVGHGASFVDHRIVTFDGDIVLCSVRLYDPERRFGGRATEVEFIHPRAVLSAAEVQGITAFCRAMKLDYGELDLVRDLHSGGLAVVDVNPAPWWHSNAFNEGQAKHYVETTRFHIFNRFWP